MLWMFTRLLVHTIYMCKLEGPIQKRIEYAEVCKTFKIRYQTDFYLSSTVVN